MDELNGGLLIKANPTKELFISMLTRDLTLNDALGEFVDNAVDGARRLRPVEDSVDARQRLRPDGRYDGLQIQIEANEKYVSISDNCGGISLPLAREYAFRFGRTKGYPKIAGSIGYFGLGMKRALFKLGQHFRISSTASRSRFVVVVKVDEWLPSDGWDFEFEEIQELAENAPHIPESERGTTITVTGLHEDVADAFRVDKTITELIDEIEREHLVNIARGLTITINGHRLRSRQLLFLQSADFKVAHLQQTFRKQLRVEMYAGISEPNLEEGGWYIFCNDRMVLGPEQTAISAWGNKHYMPKYQKKYDRFRGYLFFNADDAGLLPWNTTKNNMELDSVWSWLEYEIRTATFLVVGFLKNLHLERERIENPDDRFLEKALNATTPVALSQVVDTAHHFVKPELPIPHLIILVLKRILYYKPLAEIEKARRFFGVQSAPEVGEKTFEYFYEQELGY